MAHRSEVRGILLTEYNEVETMQLFKEDGKKEGLKEGLNEAGKQLVFAMRDIIAKEAVIKS